MAADEIDHRGRHWFFTLNNPRDDDNPWQLLEPLGAQYGVYQLEQGEQHTPHFQGYVQFRSRVRFTQLHRLDERYHWEPARDPRRAYAYCSKEAGRLAGPFPLGEAPQASSSGKRSDLLAAIATASRADLTVAEAELLILREQPNIVVRLQSFVPRVRSILADDTRRRAGITVDLHLGPPGVGKSRYQELHYPGAYWKPAGEWFDGYCGEDIVILDDFEPTDYHHSLLKRLLDRYRLRVPVKGGFVRMAASQFVISANEPPSRWYTSAYEQSAHLLPAIERRITRVFEWDAEGRVREYDARQYFHPLVRGPFVREFLPFPPALDLPPLSPDVFPEED